MTAKLLFAAMFAISVAASIDAALLRRQLKHVVTLCMNEIESCAQPTCAPIGWRR